MDKSKIIIAFRDYNAQPALIDECLPFLEGGKDLVLGLRFSDPEANFNLMTEFDLDAFPPPMADRIRATRRSPFSELLLLFYEENGVPGWKLVGGMASGLFPIADALCSQ